jgi:hypothetical protein
MVCLEQYAVYGIIILGDDFAVMLIKIMYY